MNKEIKELWLQGLRSGKYKQGHNVLRNHLNEYCCLGVLCDVISKNYPESNLTWECYGEAIFFDKEMLVLPSSIVEISGLNRFDPYIPIPADNVLSRYLSEISLSVLNDNGGSFKQISDLIEKYL